MENTLQTVAELMEIAAITAPKGAGKNFVVTKILNHDECAVSYSHLTLPTN